MATTPASTTRHERDPLLPKPRSASVAETGNADDELAPSSRHPTSEGADSHKSWRAEDTFKLAAVVLCFFATGMSVTAIGALVADIESFYSTNDSQVAFIFPTSVTGYVLAALSMPVVRSHLGWRGVALIAPSLHVMAAIVLASAPPFPVAFLGYFLGGLAAGLSDAGFCAWASKLPFVNIVQGLMHGSFSIGCVIGPLVAVSAAGRQHQWYFFYRVMLAISVVEFASLSTAFRRDSICCSNDVQGSVSDMQPRKGRTATFVTYCSLFYFCYLGIESTFSNWIISFMRRVRHFEPGKAAYSSSVFWIGMAIGRISLGPITEYLGAGIAVSVYIALSILCQFVFRLSDNSMVSLLLLGTNGVFLAPMFPSGIVLLGKQLPLAQAVTAVSIAAAIGQVGGALAPLGIGFMSDRIGMDHLPDIVLGLSGFLLLIWLAFARFASAGG